MLQNYKSATLYGILLWILIFVEVTLLMFTPGLSQIVQKLIHLVILIPLVWLCAKLYFNKAKASLKEGFLLGIYFLLIGTILDLLITLPLFVKSWSFYAQWSLWLGFLEGIIVCSLVGNWLKKK